MKKTCYIFYFKNNLSIIKSTIIAQEINEKFLEQLFSSYFNIKLENIRKYLKI